MDIKRFGPGHRRPGGPPGTQGVAGQVIYHDDRAVVSELAFRRYAIVTPHANPTNTALFIVISGGGYVQVGDERARVNHGEAVVWPPGVRPRRIHRRHRDARDHRRADRRRARTRPSDAARLVAGPTRPKPTRLTSRRQTPRDPRAGHARRAQITRDEYDSHEGEPW